MEKDEKYHVVIKPETTSKLKFSKVSKKVNNKPTPINNKLSPGIGYNFVSSDEMSGMPAVREEKIITFKDFI